MDTSGGMTVKVVRVAEDKPKDRPVTVAEMVAQIDATLRARKQEIALLEALKAQLLERD